MLRTKTLVACVIVTALLVPAVAAARGAAASPGSPQTKLTESYAFKLSIGMSEKMWTAAQVRAKHPTTGEVMVTGSMGGAMSMGGAQRHVEVHITARATGKVVTGARPKITVMDTNVKNAMAITVPFAAMQGVLSGAADLHYGNNVQLVAGHIYKVTVALKTERAVFQMRAPKS